ncbi:MAG TPA: acyl-CoA desaturase [Pirellulaceae bacterium]|nr:acyl-CoA desaturase [Pirellulaceae bacterium]
MSETHLSPVAASNGDLAPASVSQPERVSLSVRLTTLAVIIVPLVVVAAAPLFVWGWGFGWADLALLLVMYVVTAGGITVGFHRLFVHRSFETYGWVKFLFAVAGSMAVQGSLFQWAGQHRIHHQHSDKPEDPHTPHHHGGGVWGVLKGFWFSHIGWFFHMDPPDLYRYIKDLRASRTLCTASALFPLWAVLGFVLPAAFGGIVTQSWSGVLTGLIWGGLVRVFLVHHVTWSVNSICHLWGDQPFKSGDESRNNVVVGILALGEGWHNTHHAFPTSVRHGLSWWEIDASYWFIKTLEVFGLAWNLKLPSEEAVAKKRRTA